MPCLLLLQCPSPTGLYTLSLHDALPISKGGNNPLPIRASYYQDALFNTPIYQAIKSDYIPIAKSANAQATEVFPDRKSTRLNYSHLGISYAVFRLKNQKALQLRDALPDE